MSPSPPSPILPQGTSSTLTALSENFSFHSSPESFITSRVLAFQASNPSLANSRMPIRAKILNRNVAVISSYHHVQKLLCDEDTMGKLSAGKAYQELMGPFFPAPNLLLMDGEGHGILKERWKGRMASLLTEGGMKPIIQRISIRYFSGFTYGSQIDLYESMKELSWRILLTIFLSPNEKDAAEIEALQEDLLRGQFSLFPVSVSAFGWRSPRARGKAASKKLQSLLKARVKAGSSRCPFASSGIKGEEQGEDVANHLLLFTSSLAVKGLASLLTAVVLNIYVYPSTPTDTPAPTPPTTLSKTLTDLNSNNNSASSSTTLTSAILETARLSPPVVGIMRRTTQDIILPSASPSPSSPSSSSTETQIPDTLIPKGWDTWLYFTGAARDPAVFGADAESFNPTRYLNNHYSPASGTSLPPGLAFGLGPKSCLGTHLIREIVSTVAETCLGLDGGENTGSAATKSELGRTGAPQSQKLPTIDFQLNMHDVPCGVQGWLGWQHGVKPEEWARDMKQLPTQRPAKAVMVRVVHGLREGGG